MVDWHARLELAAAFPAVSPPIRFATRCDEDTEAAARRWTSRVGGVAWMIEDREGMVAGLGVNLLLLWLSKCNRDTREI